VEVNEMYWKLA